MFKAHAWVAAGLALAGLALTFFGVASADEWLPPKPEVYYASNQQFRLRVIPRPVSSQLDYFSDKVKGKTPAGQPRGEKRDFAEGVLERADGPGRWTPVWDRRLVNEVAPVSALVSPSGRYVATFDNWHSQGRGSNVVVIYGPRGDLVRAMQLSDLLPSDWIDALPHSVSSTMWSGEHRIEADDRLVLSIAVPSENEDLNQADHVPLVVRMDDGAVVAPGGPAWAHARAEATRVVAVQRREIAEAEARFRNPLVGPTTAKEGDWHLYLGEAFFRIDPNWREDYPQTVVLRSPAAADYAPSEQWLRDGLDGDPVRSDVLMIASPASSDNLVRLLKADVSRRRPGFLRRVRVYVVVDDVHRDAVAAALAPSGARFIQIDPRKPIPQRPERLRMRDGP
jgi:hypothetical protein